VYKCLHETGQAYLADELSHSSEFVCCHTLHLVSLLNFLYVELGYPHISNCVFLVASPRVWNRLPSYVTTVSSDNNFKTQFHFSSLTLFVTFLTICEVPVPSRISDTIIVRYFY